MTADDIGDYVAGTLKPELLESLTKLIEDHNKDEKAHPGFSEKIQAAADQAAAADRKADSALTAGQRRGLQRGHRSGRRPARHSKPPERRRKARKRPWRRSPS